MSGSEISRIRDLFAQAVQCLDRQSSQSSSAQSDRTARRPSRAILPSSSRFSSPSQASTSTSSCISALAERNSLFNFTKRSSCSSSGGRKAKKKRLEKAMWSHEFVCLAKADHEKTPTVMERATLTTLGEYLTLLQKICYCHEKGIILDGGPSYALLTLSKAEAHFCTRLETIEMQILNFKKKWSSVHSDL